MLIDKPLLAYTIEAALQSEMFQQVIVTTNCGQVKSNSRVVLVIISC
ncbi:hypothetical protein PL329_05095 [Escherichia coli]|nr:hypothetical protein [Escherichia coli]WCE55997.1 hypothetical protein PL329_05095 [Escherichia coli]